MATSTTTPQILFHQKKVAVALKPGGVLTQGPPGIDSFELRIKRWVKSLKTVESQPYLGVPHRLDRPVSGVMVFGLDKPTTRALAQQFEERSVEKTYWCVVSGCPTDSSGEWVDFMRKIPGEAKSAIVDGSAADEHGQLAVLRYRLLAKSKDYSLLAVQLKTGRTHQIRLQFSSRGFPILGDNLYDSAVEFGPQTLDLRERWIALHAKTIGFWHPVKDLRVEQEAPLPHYWQPLLEEMEFVEKSELGFINMNNSASSI